MFFAAVICCIAAAVSLFAMPVAVVFSALSIAVLFFLIVRKQYKYITVLITVIVFLVSLCVQFTKIDKINSNDGAVVTGEFVVASEVTDHGMHSSVTLKEYNCNSLPKNIKLLAFDYKKNDVVLGDVVNATIKISSIDFYDKYRLSDYGNGIYATANVQKISKTGNTAPFYKSASNIRIYVYKSIKTIFKGDTAGLLLALTIGDRQLLSDKFLGNIKTTGITHMIVVSGLHLSIIILSAFFVFDKFFYNKYIRTALSILFVIFIYAVCGFTMSVTRAGVMFLIYAFAPIFNRDSDSLSSLLTAVAFVLVSSPFAIVNVSFLLSVLSTLSIIWVMPFYYNVITKRFNISSKIVKTVLSAALCSIFAIIFTLPVTIKIFGYVSIIAPITNLITTYPITIALIFNVSSLLFAAIPILSFLKYPLFLVSGVCSRFTVDVVNTLAKLPVTVAVLPKGAFWWSILILALLIGYMYYYNYKMKRSELNVNSI